MNKLPFAIVGPPGTGKLDRARKFFGDTPYQENLNYSGEVLDYAHQWLLVPKESKVLKNLLKPLEEGYLQVIIVSNDIPQTVKSRMTSVEYVGFLSYEETFSKLEVDYPMATPRPAIARALNGSITDVDSITEACRAIDLAGAWITGKIDKPELDDKVLYDALYFGCIEGRYKNKFPSYAIRFIISSHKRSIVPNEMKLFLKQLEGAF